MTLSKRGKCNLQCARGFFPLALPFGKSQEVAILSPPLALSPRETKEVVKEVVSHRPPLALPFRKGQGVGTIRPPLALPFGTQKIFFQIYIW